MSYLQTLESHERSHTRQHFIASALLIAVVLCACLSRVEAQCTACPLPTFAPPVSYPVEHFSWGASNPDILAADFNNDGKPDLAVNGTSAGDVAPVEIYLNDGSGGFESPINVEVFYGYAQAIAAADFNADGNLDLVSGTEQVVSIYPGDGTGHFGAPYAYSTGDPLINDVAIGDFNNDHKPDVYVEGANFSFLFLSNGFDLTTSSPGPSGCGYGSGTEGVALADLNGDGNLDVLDCTGGVWLGDGNGNLTPREGSNAPVNNENEEGFQAHALGDFNGDGKVDIATPAFSVHLGDGTGGFAPAVFYHNGIGQKGWDIKAADINGDGKLDLITLGAGNVSILLGKGDGTFGELSTFSGAGSAFAERIAIADFNGDGKPDVAALGADADGSNPRVTLLLNSTYQTPIGTNSTVVFSNTTFTFDEVTAGGTTSVTPIDPASVGQVPGGFAVSNSVAYEIGTTATFTGSVTLAFKVPGPISQDDFNSLAILHNVNGTLVDVTASTPPRDYANLTIYATTTSFSPFYLARRGSHIKSLFDQTKAYKRGSTIPIKLQVLNASNANVSSSNTSLVTRDLRLMSGNTLAPIEDSGNANPDYTFRYDSTLGGAGGGYIFNLSTKGLASGQYVLSFYVGSERSFFYTAKFEVK